MEIKNETEIQLMKILFKTGKKKTTKNITSKRAYPIGIESKYYRQLKNYFQPLTDYVIKYINENMEPLLHGDSNNIKFDAIPGNAFKKMIYNLENWLSIYMPDISELPENSLNNVILLGLGKTADETFKFSEKDFKKTIEKGIHVNPPTTAEWWGDMKTSWAEDNYTLITSNAKNYVSKINTLTEQAIVNGLSPAKLKEEIKKATEGLSDKHCKLLARDQIGKLNGQITQAQMEEIGLELYIWSTSYDDRVRDSHAIMEGALCRWDDATLCSYDKGKTWEHRPSGAVQLHPGQDIQCRCIALAYYPELEAEMTGTSLDDVIENENYTSELENNIMQNLTDEEKYIYDDCYKVFSELDGDKNNAIEISYACVTGDFSKLPTSVLNKSEYEWGIFESKIKKAMELYDSKNFVVNEFEIAKDVFLKGGKLPKFTCTQKELDDYIAYLKNGRIFDSYEKMLEKNYGYEKYLAFAKKLGTSEVGTKTYYRGLLDYLKLGDEDLLKKAYSQLFQLNGTPFTFDDIKYLKYFDNCLLKTNIDIGRFNIYDFIKITPEAGRAWGTASLDNEEFKAIAMFDHKVSPFDKTTQTLMNLDKITIDSMYARQGIAQKLYAERNYSFSKKLSPLKLKYNGKTYTYHNDEFLRLEFSYDGKVQNYKVGQILKQTGVFATTPSELHNSIWYDSKIKTGATNPVRFHLKRNKKSDKYLSMVQIDDLRTGVYGINNPEEFTFSISEIKITKIKNGFINGDKSKPVLEIYVEIVK